MQNIPSGGQSSITIGADGRALISSADGGYLKVIHCDDRYCGSTTVTDLDSASGGDTSVTIGVDGLGLISYYRSGDLGVAHCDDLLCTSATLSWNNLAVDIGQYNSVTIGADGLPLISFYDAIDGNLMVAHCNDVACTSATTWATLDGTPVDDVGAYNSVTIGADGLGLISYYDTANGDLKVAHCRDLDCTAADITTLDSDGDVGGETSVTIGTDGLPLIGYWDNAPPYHLKVFHCGSPSCTPYFRRR